MYVYDIPAQPAKFHIVSCQAQYLAWILLPNTLLSDLSILCHTTSNPCSLVDYNNWKISAEVLKLKALALNVSNSLWPHGL